MTGRTYASATGMRTALELRLRDRHSATKLPAQLTGTSTTTVRRHIAAILRRLGVSSRFAAGAAAQRRGWIG